MAEPSFPPYNVGDLSDAAKRTAPAASRNVGPIGELLADWLPPSGVVLEIASGTGQHALAFARRFPGVHWIPSDPDPLALASITAWRAEGPSNLGEPVRLDASAAEWPIARADVIVSINMVHIAPWDAALGLIAGASRLLPAGGPLILYGPWLEPDSDPAPSNLAFDADLRARDTRWGLRDTGAFADEAEQRGLILTDRRSMPANNLMLLLRRG